MSALRQLVDEVVGAAGENPAQASSIYENASNVFHEFADQTEGEEATAFRIKADEFAQIAGDLGSRLSDGVDLDAQGQGDEIVGFGGDGRIMHDRADGREEGRLVDDFAELERARSIAAHEINEEGGDDLDLIARQGAVLQRISGGASGNSGGTSANGSATSDSFLPPVAETTRLGSIANITFQPTQDQIANQIADSATLALYSNNKKFVMALTIDIAPPVMVVAPSGGHFRPYATLNFATDATKQAIQIDVGRGQKITIQANYCDIAVALDSPGKFTNVGVWTLGASIGFFGAAGSAPVFRSVYKDDVGLAAGLGANVFDVPAKAVTLWSPQSTDLTGLSTLYFLDAGLHIVYAIQYASGGIVSPIPLTGDVAKIAVVYESSGAGMLSQSYRFPFQLAL